ncbi:hypothetical protein BO71DRAFT_402692 [Aspergillus ellipticus CBS 707.79]|uniref:Uncharacterized protein n=1 Tax=Aspergillus ellipticus CBS 707.79 TaxID=1448320 RepID=A0A319CYD3_9EURO|nr:hypothetical protein BO71DRAFT_402692 [Aspergillus ellipticus CBS 707.79]
MPTQQSPTPPTEGKPEGFAKYVKRMKTAFRRNSTAKTSAPPLPTSEQPESSKAPAPQPQPQPAPEIPIIKPAPDATIFTNWGAFQEEKARALFAKYGLALEPGEWQSSNDLTVQRVVRPIRMRVRRICHRCQTVFGPDKVCVNCQHARCKSCPRHPSSKSGENRDVRDHREHTELALQAIVAQKMKSMPPPPRARQPPLAMSSHTGGQDAAPEPGRPNIKRTCHRCSTVFEPDARECSICKHLQCTMCPRETPKSRKHPHGFPGDEIPMEPPARTWKRPRQRIRYKCHQCLTLYRSGQTNCSNCGQEKGPQTLRDPPHKVKPQPDPEIVRRVEERLAKVRITAG